MKNKTKFLTAVFILILISMACGGSSIPATSTPTAIVFFQATEQALTASAPKPPLTFAPLPFVGAGTAFPTAQGNTAQGNIMQDDTASAKPIYFATGATSAFITETILPGQVIVYSLDVVGNQPGQMSIASPNNNITLALYNPDKSELLSPVHRSNSWQGYFEKSGIYLVKVYGGVATSEFKLSIGISARVTLATGTTDIKVKGKTVGGKIISYAVQATKGQTLDVTINTAPEDAALTVWGFTDRKIYARADAGITSFSMLLPETQDYIIDVVPQPGMVLTYFLSVSIK